MSNVLHRYQCSPCFQTAVATYWTPGVHVHCPLCRRFMKHLYEEPITTDQHRQWAAQGIVYNPHLARPVAKCQQCKQPMPDGPSVVLECVGKFCGEDCAQEGVLKHQRYMERTRQHREEMANAWRRTFVHTNTTGE